MSDSPASTLSISFWTRPMLYLRVEVYSVIGVFPIHGEGIIFASWYASLFATTSTSSTTMNGTWSELVPCGVQMTILM
jgi:hypothetical protein